MNGRLLRVFLSSGVLLAVLSSLVALQGLSGRGTVTRALAQADSEEPWTVPVNLSNSGGVSPPRMVIDSQGVMHVLWQDELAGATYTRFADGTWSEPVSVVFPFGEVLPTLVATDKYVHAFWVEPSRDNMLLHSRVAIEKVGNGMAWEKPKTLVKYVNGFDVAYRGEGRMDLAYLHSLEEPTLDRPAGVIYRQSEDEGASWSFETVVYPSRYFRTLKPGESNIQIAATQAGEQPIVSIVWDNPPLKRVFFARSVDGGTTWEPPLEVDGPTAGNVSGEPFGIRVSMDGNRGLMLWRGNMQSGVYCTQYYQTTQDGGKTWSEHKTMLQSMTGCPQDNSLYESTNGATLLQTTIKDQVYLLAWDGEKWSEPQLQNRLSGFDNPVTNDPVVFRCQQPEMVNGNRLVVTGCDEQPGGDIWITMRDIGVVDEWFPPPSSWGQPLTLTTSGVEVFQVDAVRDAEGVVHILWTQYEPPEEEDQVPTRRSFYYSNWDGKEISAPSQVQRSPDSSAGAFSLAYDMLRNRLGIAWNDRESGVVYFSWADVGRATSSLEWSEPVIVPALHPLAGEPHLRIGADGAIYIAYALPINEDRGVYLNRSLDGGETWVSPATVFNAGNTNWQAVGAPRLALTAGGVVHSIWPQSMIVAAGGMEGVYYSQSGDGGSAWPAPQIAYNEPVEALWIENSSQQGLHRFWLGQYEATVSVYQDFSLDGGANWSLPANLTGLDEKPRSVRPYALSNGSIGLVQVVEDKLGRMTLKNREWDGNAWQQDDNLILPETAADQLYSLAASSGSEDKLSAVYVSRRISSGLADEPWQIILWNRFGPGAQPDTTLPTPTVIATAAEAQTGGAPVSAETQTTADAPETAAIQTEPALVETPGSGIPAITPTSVVLPTALTGGEPSQLTSDTVGMALAAGAALLVAIAFFAASRMRWR